MNLIKLEQLTKSTLSDIVGQVVKAVEAGNSTACEAVAFAKFLEEIAGQIKKATINDNKVTELAFDEAAESVNVRGAVVSQFNATRYDYSTCNDEMWNQLTEDIKDLSNMKKSREVWLKALTKESADPVTGEMVMPPLKKVSDSVKISFK